MTAPVPPLPTCVINSAAYDREGRRRDISLDEISDVLAVDDGSFVWVGLFEPDEAVLAKLQEEFDSERCPAACDQSCRPDRVASQH